MNESPRISDGMLLAAATLGGYALAFAYEAGYVGYFGVPLDLVSVDVTRVLVALAAVLGLVWFLFLIFNPLSIVLHSANWPSPVMDIVSRFVVPLIYFVACWQIFGLNSLPVVTAIMMFLMTGFFVFLFPLLTQHRTRGYRAKLEAQSELENAQVSVSPIIMTAIQLVGPSGFRIMFFAAVTLYAAFNIGRGEAGKRDWFYCPADSSSTALVRAYGSTMFGVRYDPVSHHLLGELVIGTRGEGQWAALRWKHVGRLAAATERK